jgi:ribosomal protein L24E
MVKYRFIPAKCIYCGKTVGKIRVNVKFRGNIIWTICEKCEKLLGWEAGENGS